MPTIFKNLSEAIAAQTCRFCDAKMLPAPNLSFYSFRIDESRLSYGPKSSNGLWTQMSLNDDWTGQSPEDPADPSHPVIFIFECPVHRYISNIEVTVDKSRYVYANTLEQVLFLDGERVILVQSLLDFSVTEIRVLPIVALKDEFDYIDVELVHDLEFTTIAIDLVRIGKDSEKFLSKIKTYIALS